jgi:hypothetical protein
MVVSDEDEKGPSQLGSIIGGNGVGVFGPSLDLGGADQGRRRFFLKITRNGKSGKSGNRKITGNGESGKPGNRESGKREIFQTIFYI